MESLTASEFDMRVAVLAMLCALACSETPSPADAGTPRGECSPGEAVTLPPAVCGSGTRWAPGQKAFRDATEAWGLSALNVQGFRLSTADLDGDGWADLLVRRGGVRSDDFAEGGARHAWVLRNTGNKTFIDVTQASGLLRTRAQAANVGRPGEVWAFADVDNDGDLDAYTGLATDNAATSLGETSELLFNRGDGTFELSDVNHPLRREGIVDTPSGATFLDFDRDGLLDLWVTQLGWTDGNRSVFEQDRLWKGDGAGFFADVTFPAGLTTEGWSSADVIDAGRAHSRAWASLACDLNGDGLQELLAASYGRAPNHLWQARRQPDGSIAYENRSVASGFAFDDDRTWQDNQFARCYCASNPRAEGCEGVGVPLISCEQQNWSHASDRRAFRLGGNSGTTVCADFDRDGDFDLLTTEIRHWWAGAGSDHAEILQNTGESEPRFLRPGRAATGLEVVHETQPAWDEGIITAAAFDFDNDGRTDVYLGGSEYAGNRGLLFHHTLDALGFEPVPVADGIDHHRSHGLAVADFDRDGDLDIVVGHSRSRCDAQGPADCYPTTQVRFFENLAGDESNWVQLKLEGCGACNRTAVGARVRVTTSEGTQTQQVSAGHGHYGMQDDLVLHFGLGAACEADVTIDWPDRLQTQQTFQVTAGHRFHVRLGDHPRVATR